MNDINQIGNNLVVTHEMVLKLKSTLSEAIDEMRYLTEKYCVNTSQKRDIIEIYKESIFLVNQKIKKCNQHNPKREIALLKVNFNLWRTYEGNSLTGGLPQAIITLFDTIVANLGYRHAYNTALTSKAAYHLIRSNACNAFRVRFFCYLENYVKNRRFSFSSRTGLLDSGEVIKGSKIPRNSERYTLEYDRHLIFEQAIKFINNFLGKAKLSEKNVIRISQDWSCLQEIFSTSQNW